MAVAYGCSVPGSSTTAAAAAAAGLRADATGHAGAGRLSVQPVGTGVRQHVSTATVVVMQRGGCVLVGEAQQAGRGRIGEAFRGV